jgi:heat shock protein HslJ
MRPKYGVLTLMAFFVLVACTRQTTAPVATSTTPGPPAVTVATSSGSNVAAPATTTLFVPLSSSVHVNTRVVEALGDWTLESATTADDVSVPLDPVYPNRLIFGGVAAVHAIIADLGCNDFSAEGAAIVNGRLELKNPSSTAVGCVEQIVQEREHMLDGLLESRPTVEIAGDLLTLRGMGTAIYRRTST